MAGALLRFFSYLYHLVFGLFLVLLSLVILLSGKVTLNLETLLWKTKSLPICILGTAVIGLVSLVLAWMGRLKWVFLLYTLTVLGILFRGFFLTPFELGPTGFWWAIGLTLGALLAVCGAWSQWRRKDRNRR